MSQLMKAMDLLRAIFDKYAGKEGAKDTLTKKELAELLRAELGAQEPQGKAEVEKFFGMLDNDGDGVVSFEEYVSFVAALTVIINSNE
ncbi:ictacalcin [Etheostoma spectabile]|uniref:ictacalcin n=1 Tax=Etheostoma spectabile TaxID=54343 RepID=UPI0013AEE739|nr:ictacalcin-like [Etheostoma spectabile]